MLQKKNKKYLVSSDTQKFCLRSLFQPLVSETRPDSGDDVSWFPDAETLLLGRSTWWDDPPSKDPAGVYTLHLSTHRLSFLSGTERLSNPQLSTDGRWLVAQEASKLVLYDVATHKKSDLAKTEPGADSIGWSRDGSFFYFANMGETGVVILRVQIRNRSVERIAELKNLKLVNGASYCWMGLAPDDSPLLLRDVGSQDMYALDWAAP